ncbi:MAG: aldo/keto reductase [bacterium]
MKLAIGTVQFGIQYGINKNKKTSLTEISKILDTAKRNNINFLDSAPLYGDSEKRIGSKTLLENDFKIVTKTPHFNKTGITEKELNLLETTFKKSLKNLNKKNIYGLLIHNAEDLFSKNGSLLISTLNKFKEKKLIEKIGVSVYTPEQIKKIIENFEIDIIQLPINILDQRLIQNGYLQKLKEKNIEIHARSIFLQGLLIKEPEILPNFFNSIKPLLKKFHQNLNELNISPIEASLNFAKNIKEIDKILIGVNNNKQLLENINAYNKNIKPIYFKQFECTDENIINPTKWKFND